MNHIIADVIGSSGTISIGSDERQLFREVLQTTWTGNMGGGGRLTGKFAAKSGIEKSEKAVRLLDSRNAKRVLQGYMGRTC